MNSPFPGMDPYIESHGHWEDFHKKLIGDMERHLLVTAIEVLSPSNKRRGTPGWDLYQRKRQGLLLGQANFVEIDLVRERGRLPMLDPWPKSPYAILVVRRDRAPLGRAWPAYFDRPLPEVPIPLLYPDPDYKLALQPLVDDIYQRSRYSQVLDYNRPLKPPFKKTERAWLEERLQKRERSTHGPVPRPTRKRGRPK